MDQIKQSILRALRPQHVEQIDMLYRNSGFPLLVTFVAASGLVWLLIAERAASPTVCLVWLALIATHIVARMTLRAIFLRTPDWAENATRWGVWNALGALIAGITWGFGILWLLPPDRVDLQMMIIITTTGVSFGSLAAFGSYPPSFYGAFIPMTTPSYVWALMLGDRVHVIYTVLGIMWSPAVSILASRYSRNLVDAIALQHEYAAQRAIAEQASLSKSRFLASASHDLRQPVHALGMFLGALRDHQLPPRSLEVIEHMDTSIAALDGLFSSILDISRLDAGVSTPHLAPIALQPILTAAYRDFAITASAKGLRFDLVDTSLCVFSDPVMLGRMVRNLIANAVTYTAKGRVLLGCRQHATSVDIEVWDTGLGIDVMHREAIFEEFYQVANPDRDRTKGLGLGLTIVRRLANLCGHAVTLESWPGKGSMFRIRLERRADAPLVEPALPISVTASTGGLVVAIDDELAVRTAMAQLLKGWGYRTVIAWGGDDALEQLATCPVRPDLLICDFRLRGGENGLDTIERLLAEYAHDIPALLLTGDTAPERIIEAEQSGVMLLHKPVGHELLRETIATLIQRGRERNE